ncbi:unnamed protein product [marine sediment metagenome]|uniref:Uncharacterized protein n=1 Tax=marine sediment metagenome TaxID=412755 RepID=X0SEU9_9ZZZZ
MTIDIHDDKKKYCRILGHELTFTYCRQTAAAQPCGKIFDCWFETFDIDRFMKKHFTPDQLKTLLTPQKPKMASLIELIQQAQKTTNENKPDE